MRQNTLFYEKYHASKKKLLSLENLTNNLYDKKIRYDVFSLQTVHARLMRRNCK